MKKVLVVPGIVLTLATGIVNNVFAQEINIIETDATKNTDITKFKEILDNPENVFDFKISEARYTIKSTDTEYLLISATSEELNGIYSVKVFAFDKEKNSLMELEEEFIIGDNAGKFTGKLEEYTNNVNKLRYTVQSITNDKFEIKNITFEKNEIRDETVREGFISKDKIPQANVKELIWKTLELKKEDNSQQTASTESTAKDKKIEEKPETNTQSPKPLPKIEKKTDKKSKFNIDEIVGGNLSSIIGEVHNDTVIKNSSSVQIVSNGVVLGIDSIKKQGNTAVISSTSKEVITEGFGVVDAAPVYHYIVPAGEKSPVEVENDDISRDRIITQIHANKEVSFVG